MVKRSTISLFVSYFLFPFSRFFFSRKIACLCFLAAFGSQAYAVDVTLRLVDQYGADIEGSHFSFGNPLFVGVPNGGSIDLAPGGYGVYVVPAVFGIAHQPSKNRYDNFVVAEDTTEIIFVWEIYTGPITVKDQFGQNIPGSYVSWGNPYFKGVASGDNVSLPVGGYGAYIVPGVFGIGHQPTKNRYDNFEVTTDMTEIEFVWETFTGPINIVNQNGDPIAGSYVNWGNPYFKSVVHGDLVTLPVGAYGAYIVPSVFGTTYQPGLNRYDNFSVDTSLTELRFEWKTAEGRIYVVDGNEQVIPNSSIYFGNPFGISLYNDQEVFIPVGGYGAYMRPGDIAPGQPFVNFTVSVIDSVPVVSPEFFDVNGINYGIRIVQDNVVAVNIDIKPGSDNNCINNNGNGVIPVAILGSETFSVDVIDPTTVQLESMPVKVAGKKMNLLASIGDANGDPWDDLIVHIEDIDGVFSEGASMATLNGEMFDGTPIMGSDTICIVP